MGQGKSSLINAPLYNLTDYEEYQKVNDARYGNMKPLVHKTTKQDFVALSKTLQDEKELQQRAGELAFRQALLHPNLVRLVNYNSQKQDDFCSSFFTLGLLYEYWGNNLRSEIQERRQFNEAYREGELWYLLDSLVNVVAYLKQKGVDHGDIRPYNVLLTFDGVVKVGEVYMHSKSLSGYSQLLNHSLEELYISPQLFKALSTASNLPQYDADKSEIYAVGLTVLEAATLENVSSVLYDTQSFTVRNDEINRLLNQVRQQYSFQLYSVLARCLQEQEQDRANVEDLQAELSQPFVLSQKLPGLSIIEVGQHAQPNDQLAQQQLLEQQQLQQLQQQQLQQEQEYEEKVQRSAPVAVQQQQQQQTSVIYYPNDQPKPVAGSNIVFQQEDDLDARIQAVLALSKQTIAKYGTNSTIITSPQLPIDAKASQIETRTYLNSNTNSIETQNYLLQQQKEQQLREQQQKMEFFQQQQALLAQKELQQQQQQQQYQVNSYSTQPQTQVIYQQQPAVQQTTTQVVDDIVKRSQPVTQVAPVQQQQQQYSTYEVKSVPYTGITYQVNNTDSAATATAPVVNQYQQYTSATYTPTTTFTPSSYTQQGVVQQQQQQAPQQVTEYQTSSTLDFKTNEEREAYITKLLANRTSPVSNVSSKVTYTTFTDGKPAEKITSYTNNLATPTY